MSEGEQCACGQPLHYSDPAIQALVERLIARLGPEIPVQVGARAWRVPRHYIALHGLKAWELPALATRYGWEEVS
jgi:hypothetical protein